jgi:threonine aldolase
LKVIDLRSDTITQPSHGMRKAMMKAEVGDDVFSEDPTVNKLQDICAGFTGKEASIYTPSGTMANQLALKCQTNEGDEVIIEADCHILNYETAGASFISRVQLLPVTGEYGVLNVADLSKYVRPGAYYYPRTRMICIENTHNRAGGTIYPIDKISELSEFAKTNNILLHIDGARIFNASAETGVSVKEYASYCDSISFCFSKGLGAPVGSVLCSSEEVITKARKFRKILGGGMRQVGILAAAAVYALENNIERLKEDNSKAKYFATEISKIDGIEVDLASVHTNIVIFRVNHLTEEFKELLKEKGILLTDGVYGTLRAVFHLDVSMDEVKKAIKIFKQCLN